MNTMDDTPRRCVMPTRCSCDDFADDPCPVHARENAQQNEVLALREDRDHWRKRAESAEKQIAAVAVLVSIYDNQDTERKDRLG
jgi:hypothetical protein